MVFESPSTFELYGCSGVWRNRVTRLSSNPCAILCRTAAQFSPFFIHLQTYESIPMQSSSSSSTNVMWIVQQPRLGNTANLLLISNVCQSRGIDSPRRQTTTEGSAFRRRQQPHNYHVQRTLIRWLLQSPIVIKVISFLGWPEAPKYVHI
jgi:hypothetical protein